jgi:hypothetical protein
MPRTASNPPAPGEPIGTLPASMPIQAAALIRPEGLVEVIALV